MSVKVSYIINSPEKGQALKFPVHSPESSEIAQDYMDFEQARAVIRLGQREGRINYEDLVGVTNYPPAWDDYDDGSLFTENQKQYNHERSKRGFRHFMRVFTDESTEKAGITSVPDKYDLTNFGDMDGLVDIAKEAGCKRISAGNIGLEPRLHYQTARTRESSARGTQRADFLHFGLYANNSLNPVKLSPELKGAVRLYLNPQIEDTAETAALLCKGFIAEHGYMPTGKFMEDVTSWRVEERDDRLLFWAKSPEELTTLLRLTHLLQEARPQLFDNRQPIILGESVQVDDKELKCLRIGQDPNSSNNQPSSFSSSSIEPLELALNRTFGDSVPKDPKPADVTNFIETLRQIGPAYNRNSMCFSFNNGQDLSVIYSAIRAAGTTKK